MAIIKKQFLVVILLVVLMAIVGCTNNSDVQTGQDSSICMVDTGCNDESTTGSEITGNIVQETDPGNPIVVYFFWGDGCPHCAEQKPFLDSLKQKYPLLEVKMFETWYNGENAELFQQMAESFGTSVQGVPTTFIGNKYWVGFADYMKPEIEDYIEYCLENGCTNRR